MNVNSLSLTNDINKLLVFIGIFTLFWAKYFDYLSCGANSTLLLCLCNF